MTDDTGWCTIESDPAVFTEMLKLIGVKNVQLEEIYSLNRDHLDRFGQVYGVVFLFKYRYNEQESAKSRSGRIVPVPDGLFFANQTIRNACATQAILSVVLNAPIEIGEELKQFKTFSAEMDPMTKGMVLSNSEMIREAHNSFAVPQTLIVDNPTGKKEDPFHFVAYIPWNGSVYELDGLQAGPRELGPISSDSWLDVVTPEVASRIGEYGGSEIRFNLMVVVEDQRQRLQKQLTQLQEEGATEEQLNETQNEYFQQTEKHAVWKRENNRRKWNFMPLIVDFLKLLAKTGHVEDVIDKAAKRKREAYQQALESQKDNSSDQKS